MKIIISGLGVMGGSLAMAIKQNLPDLRIRGFDSDSVLQEALRRKIIDEKIERWPQDCAGADLIFLATPLHILQRQLNDLNGIIDGQTVVTDVGSTKEELAAFVEKIHFSGVYIGGHPMTGAEKSGLSAATPLLYENAVYLLSNITADKEHILHEKLLPVLKAIKARVMLIDAKIHDEILAAISHLPQILAIELVNLVGAKNSPEEPYFALAAGGFRDLTRIASSSVDIWQGIIRSNKDNVRSILKHYIRRLESVLDKMDDLHQEFESANNYRQMVPKESKGFLSPLTDILVYVTDQVGVVAKISNTLARKKIDIRDMELLKIREKEGGVFRLSFANRQEAQTAADVLNDIGFQAFIRE